MSGQWVTDAAGTQNWSTATNWSGGTIADGADNTATFDKNLTVNRTATLNTSRTIGYLVFSNTPGVNGSSTNLTIGVSASSVLTLSVSSGTPTVTVFNGSSTLSPVVAGSAFIKNGGGGIVLGAADPGLTGSFTVNAGTLRANNVGAFNGLPISETADVTTIYHNAAGTYSGTYSIIGYGVSENDPGDSHLGAIRMAAAGITLSGTITLAGNAGITSRGSSQAGDTISGQITGGFGIRFGRTTTSSGNASGGTIFLSNPNNNWTGDTTIADGTLKLGAAAVIPNGNGFGNVVFTNPGVAFNANGVMSNSVLDLNGFNETINGLANDPNVPGTDLFRLVVTNGSGTAATLTVGDGNASASFAGVIGGGNSLSVTKIGSGTETLSGANTYTGNTTISAGSLALSGSGSIANTPQIIVAGGATFDVSGLSSAFNLGAGQTLSNSTSTAVLNAGSNGANTGSGTVSLTYASGTPSFTVTNGTLTLSSSTTLKVNNTGSALAVGNYKLVSKATSGNTGSVAGTVPSSVTVTGGGIAGGTTASLQITSGELFLAVASSSPPKLARISISGTTLTVVATNGTSGAQWTLMQSTNLAVPLSQWITNSVLTFAPDGKITNTANVATNAQTFYILKQ